MLTRRDLVSDGPPCPSHPPSRTPHLLSASSPLSFSDPQALNDFLHGSEKVSAGQGLCQWGPWDGELPGCPGLCKPGLGSRRRAEGMAEPVLTPHTAPRSTGRPASKGGRRRNDGVTRTIRVGKTVSGGGDRAFFSQRGREGSLCGSDAEGEPEGREEVSAVLRAGRSRQEAGRWGREVRPEWTVTRAARPGRRGSRSSGVAVSVAGGSGGGGSLSGCSGAMSVTRGRLSERPTVGSETLVSVLASVTVGSRSSFAGAWGFTGSAGAAAT